MTSQMGGPQSILDLVLVGLSVIVVLFALCSAIRYTLWPGEESPDHIKRRILKDDLEEGP